MASRYRRSRPSGQTGKGLSKSRSICCRAAISRCCGAKASSRKTPKSGGLSDAGDVGFGGVYPCHHLCGDLPEQWPTAAGREDAGAEVDGGITEPAGGPCTRVISENASAYIRKTHPQGVSGQPALVLSVRYGKSGAISPFDGDAFFTSQINESLSPARLS